jgi:Cof subfamily protein (haloacid dehalogenase superfamily)
MASASGMNQSAGERTIRLVISDVDGTLLDGSAQLTQAARDAIASLHGAGIRFTIASSRPPEGTAWLREALRITEPIAALNGALILSERGILSEILIARSDVHAIVNTILNARQSREAQLDSGFDLWAFVDDEWYVTNLGGYRVAEHSRDNRMTPKMMPPITEFDQRTAKLVGVSKNADAVLACQHKLESMRPRISATRSKPFYLDVTHADANKGNAVSAIAQLTGVPLDEVATLGDMPTDVLMFRRTGFSVAMGNAPHEVKSTATFVTDPNTEDGFAKAITRLIALTNPAASLSRFVNIRKPKTERAEPKA